MKGLPVQILSLVMTLALATTLIACGNAGSQEQPKPSVSQNTEATVADSRTEENESEPENTDGDTVQSDSADETERQEESSEESKETVNRILVTYFSRTGENYSVGYIEKGNTHIIADMIAKSTEEVKVEANGTDGVTVTKGDDSMTIKFTVSTVVPAMYPTFSYDANGVKITLDGVTAAKDAVTGDNVKSFKANDASFMIDVVLIKDATVTIAALVDDIVSKSTENVTITKTSDGNGVVIVSGDNSATIKFSVDTGAEEVKHVFEVGDQTITFENGNVTVYVSNVDRSSGEPELLGVEDEDEWAKIKDVLRELSKSE